MQIDFRMRAGLAVAIVVVAAAVQLGAEIIDRVLAVAGGELIMLSDVVAARDLRLVSVDSSAANANDVALGQLIDRQLVLVEVDRFAPPEPSTDAVDRELLAVRGRFANPQLYQAALARSGISENQLRETLRQNLRIRTYEQERFTVPPPRDEELVRYYAAHRAAFARDGETPSFDAVRDEVVRAVVAERRAALVNEWTADLRRRADIILSPVQ